VKGERRSKNKIIGGEGHVVGLEKSSRKKFNKKKGDFSGNQGRRNEPEMASLERRVRGRELVG